MFYVDGITSVRQGDKWGSLIGHVINWHIKWDMTVLIIINIMHLGKDSKLSCGTKPL